MVAVGAAHQEAPLPPGPMEGAKSLCYWKFGRGIELIAQPLLPLHEGCIGIVQPTSQFLSGRSRMKRRFVVPSLKEEADLARLTLGNPCVSQECVE